MLQRSDVDFSQSSADDGCPGGQMTVFDSVDMWYERSEYILDTETDT